MPLSVSTDCISDISRTLRDWCDGNCARGSAERLIRVAIEFCRFSPGLNHKIQRAADVRGITFEQLSMSLVAVLFCDHGSKSTLAAALRETCAEDDTALYLRFRRTAIQAAAHELYHRWPETDPNAARMDRLLKQVFRSDDRLCCFPRENPQWVALSSSSDHREGPRPWDLRELQAIVLRVSHRCHSLDELVVTVLEEVTPDNQRQSAVAISILQDALLEGSRIQALESYFCQSGDAGNHIPEQVAARRARDEVSRELRGRLSSLDDGNGIVERRELYQSAIDRLLEELAETGQTRWNWQYLTDFSQTLTPEQYRSDHRAFEYQAHWAQDRFKHFFSIFLARHVGKHE